MGPVEPGLSNRPFSWLSPLQSKKVRLVLGFVPLLLITGYILVTRPNLEHLSGYGYFGVFVVMMVSNATVLLPMPGLATVVAAGLLWSPVLVGIAGGLGGATGELVGYVAGYGAHDMLDSKRAAWLERLHTFVRRYGFVAVLILSAIPNPFFDVVGLAAGSLSYPAWRFFIAVAIGNSIKCMGVATLGSTISGWLAL